MKLLPGLMVTVCATGLSAGAAQAQYYHNYRFYHNDIALAGTGVFTTPISPSQTGVSQYSKEAVGGLFTLRIHPIPYTGFEFNYGYNHATNTYVGPGYSATPAVYAHEATAAYLLHAHLHPFQPFLGIGGGAVDFVPKHGGQSQWRGAGLAEAGADIPTASPHVGFRVQARALFYRVPNFNQANLSTRSWVATIEPTVGIWFRY